MSNILRNDSFRNTVLALTGSVLALSLASCSDGTPIEQSGGQFPDKKVINVTHITSASFKSGKILIRGSATLTEPYDGAHYIQNAKTIEGAVYCDKGQVVESTNLTNGVAVSIMSQAIPQPNPCRDGELSHSDSEGFDIMTFRGDSELIESPAGLIVLAAAAE